MVDCSASLSPQASNIEPPIGHGELILIVDDEAAICEITQAALEEQNYKVLTSSDGIEALALYAQHQDEISLVLTDMMMPLMDGSTTIHTLQKLNPQLKIIAVSGLASNEQVVSSSGVGVKAFLMFSGLVERLRSRTSVQRVETMIGKPDFWISNTALNFSAGPFIVE